MKIDGLTALVTGGASGLGAATAQALATKGAKVAIFDRNGDAAMEKAGRIGGLGLAGDVSSEADVIAALDKTEATLGPVRILVNCAGIGTAARMVGREGAQPLEDFERVIRVNLIGTFNVMRLTAARMTTLEPLEDNARGVIVNTASVAAQDGQIGQAAYAASKGGIVAMALPVARELSRFGIRVNTIAPGIFYTPLLGELPEEARESIAASVPYPARLGDPAEFADAVLFAVETQYLNAEMIRLDGGIRLQPK
ncbi:MULTISPECIES: SDR family NAD(P)-dependent oxidoreductase [Alphaproteobacteria]|uniref:3-hydroxy-2-methylbutyryl-CoA dehydrogenase n=2 Tax=Alphaproteobacteria TaxID=28211 RepID=A0A512HH33_9HYPH|nr:MULTISPECIES: SDR family NAD(P)-dependent oxidoreductase [Alphaproteobacteria]GEO84758.1 3-hydroxy-2-methylbutyryl-CoA dehydrogenase [Ciceribacter naphthalenivorans]GLR20621.1 3-hydroxy-2-methylbutyryl-CoA dehydrogenase [Ciceribacter naphthalenivorans]GLT03477.1 3-hydroxy-2-methylbutyryl-CoA dehydrogenase [Sphingomonas psychrolutea]